MDRLPACPTLNITRVDVRFRVQPLLKIFRKLFDRALDRPGRGITEWTKRFTFDVVADVEHKLSVLGPTAARCDPIENFHEPVGAFTAGCTPSARLVFVKLGQ